MSIFEISAIIITIAAAFSFINYKFLKLPTTIGAMMIALIVSTILIILHSLGINLELWAEKILQELNFSEALLKGMLGFLLFAGALHINLDDLFEQKVGVSLLSTIGVLGSTFIIGLSTFWVLSLLGIHIPFIYTLVFGALISPTDPIAVLSILKQNNAPKELETKIAGESLFNDGIGVVIFLALVEIATGHHEVSIKEISFLFIEEAIGGTILGLFLGWVGFQLIKRVDDYQVEILLTLALVSGGYSLAQSLHFSGPIAIVIAGLMIGNRGRRLAMSENTRQNLDKFWQLIDEVLNIVLFVLIGMELIVISFNFKYFIAGLSAIIISLLARLIMVSFSIKTTERINKISYSKEIIPIITWAGLRGGISIALALSLPESESKNVILAITYCVVVFSIVVQGLSIKKLLPKGLKVLTN
ncbi:MAG: sodium:proton antiporter [Candidatus Caenarcaniphilales bacterium]|nr:sodium:proton antiporter [Candidatus Caenarcaniphilales bacterium]